MSPAVQYAAAAALLAISLPLVAWLARKAGRRASRGHGLSSLAALMLGFGEAADPPSKHMIEAADPKAEDKPTPGDPPTTPP